MQMFQHTNKVWWNTKKEGAIPPSFFYYILFENYANSALILNIFSLINSSISKHSSNRFQLVPIQVILFVSIGFLIE